MLTMLSGVTCFVTRILPPLETTLPTGHAILRYLHPSLFIWMATYKLFLEAVTR